jgi:wobble nucleotide-excising tRNase
MGPDLEFKKINFIYGFNGSGKTSFSNILRLFSEDFTIEEKEDIFKKLRNNENTEGEFEIVWDDRKINKLSEIKNIFVFNSTFVSDHISQGKLKKFREEIVTKEHLENPKIKVIEDKLLDLKKYIEGLDREMNYPRFNGRVN